MSAQPAVLQLPGGVSLTLPGEALEALAEYVREILRSDPSKGAVEEDRWMDAKEAARYLGFRTTNPIHKLTAARQVPFAQDTAGGKCWFKRSELDKWRQNGGAHR